jgi:bifunctional DNA-binding transcriptional regulator/antitoxin component of YhaV-PrlF toxin-antitoxin module
MQSIRLTSKRQATFPIKLCQELGVKPGDHLILERKNIEGDIAWTLKPKKSVESKWFAGLKKYAKNKDHNLESIRITIGKAIGEKIK